MSIGAQPIMPVLLDSGSADGTTFLADISPGKYSYIGLNFDITGLAACDDLVEAEVGRVRISEQGRDIVNAEADRLANLMRREGGNGFFTSTTATSADFVFLIPRKYGNDGNAHLVTEQDLLQLSITHEANYDTAVTAGTIEVYGLLSETGEHNYNLKILQFEQNISANAVETIRVTEENVIGLYYDRSGGANASRIRVMRDGQEVVNGSLQALSGFSDSLGNTDSLSSGAASGNGVSGTHHDMVAMMFAGEGEIGEFLSDDIKIEITQSGTGDDETIVVLAADFAPSKLRQSKVETASIIERKLARKNKLNRSRPIQSLRIAAE